MVVYLFIYLEVDDDDDYRSHTVWPITISGFIASTGSLRIVGTHAEEYEAMEFVPFCGRLCWCFMSCASSSEIQSHFMGP